MKVKTFHVLLLSAVMIAGVVTINDAFAQTNTERLSTVVDTTSDTNERVVQLTEIWNNFGSQFTPITNALNMVAAEVTTMSGDISDLSDDVMAASAKVDALEDKLDEYAATRASDSTELKERIDSLSETLPDIQNRISTLAGDSSVGDLVDKVDAITTQLNEFSNTLATIQTEVESIQGELGIVKETAEAMPGEAPKDLTDYEFTEDVKLAWYAHRLTEPDPNHKYAANYNFVCQSDVFITSVSSDIGLGTGTNTDFGGFGTNGITFYYNGTGPGSLKSEDVVANPVYYNAPTGVPTSITHPHPDEPRANLKVAGALLFESIFTNSTLVRALPTTYGVQIDVSPGNQAWPNIASYPHIFTPPMEIKAGEPLVFESTTQARGVHAVTGTALSRYASVTINTANASSVDTNGALVDINATNTIGVTKAQLGDATVYSVTIKYLSEFTAPQCKLTPAYIAPLDNKNQTVFVSPDISGDSGDGILTTYESELDCHLNTVRITDVTADLTGATDFNNYIDMKLLVGKDTKAEFTFANNTSILNEEYSYPIEFEAANLKIEGNALVGSGLVIQFTYDTIADGTCIGKSQQ